MTRLYMIKVIKMQLSYGRNRASFARGIYHNQLKKDGAGNVEIPALYFALVLKFLI